MGTEWFRLLIKSALYVAMLLCNTAPSLSLFIHRRKTSPDARQRFSIEDPQSLLRHRVRSPQRSLE
jgi:hypothetical protein